MSKTRPHEHAKTDTLSLRKQLAQEWGQAEFGVQSARVQQHTPYPLPPFPINMQASKRAQRAHHDHITGQLLKSIFGQCLGALA